MPMRTASAFSRRTAASTRRFHEASTSAFDPYGAAVHPWSWASAPSMARFAPLTMRTLIGAPVSAALRGPVHQQLEHGVALGQVGLEHDARLDTEELLLGQDLGERVDGQRQVAVLLHVEVDEGPRGGRHRGAVQPAQPFGHPLDRSLLVVGAQLRGDRGDLHRDVGHLWAPQHLDHPVQAVGGFLLAQHGLAQDVDVEASALGGPLGQVAAQGFWLRRQDDPLGGGPDLPVDQPHRP